MKKYKNIPHSCVSGSCAGHIFIRFPPEALGIPVEGEP